MSLVYECVYEFLLKKLQTAQINQQTVTMKEAPKECVQDMDEESLLSVYASAFKHLFTFQKDNCQHYYEHLLIDPLLKVTPTKVCVIGMVTFHNYTIFHDEYTAFLQSFIIPIKCHLEFFKQYCTIFAFNVSPL